MPRKKEPAEERHGGKIQFLENYMEHLFNGDLRGQARPYGFVLLVFPFGDDPIGARCNYISNAERSDAVAAMKAMIDHE